MLTQFPEDLIFNVTSNKPCESIINSNARGLLLVQSCQDTQNHLSQKDGENLSKFLLNIQGEASFNKSIKNSLVIFIDDILISKEVLELLARYIYKTRRASLLDSSIENFRSLQNDGSPGLKSSDLGIIYERYEAENILKDLFLTNKLPNDSELLRNADEAKRIITNIFSENEKVFKNLNRVILFFEHGKHRYDFLGHQRPCQKIVNSLVTFRHTSILSSSDEQLMLAHLPKFYSYDPLTVAKISYSEIYEFDISKLIDQSDQRAVEGLYGKKWRNTINKEFKDIVDSFLCDEKRFSNFRSHSVLKELFGFLASWIPFFNLRITENDFGKIHQRMTSTFHTNNMASKDKLLCSEFTAMAIIAAIKELNSKIQSTRSESYSESDVLLSQSEIIKMPFGRHENLSRMLPDRLLEILQKSKCITKIEPKFVEAFIQ